MILYDKAVMDIKKMIRYAPRVMTMVATIAGILTFSLSLLVHVQTKKAVENLRRAESVLNDCSADTTILNNSVISLTESAQKCHANLSRCIAHCDNKPKPQLQLALPPPTSFCSSSETCIMDIGAQSGDPTRRFLVAGSKVLALDAHPVLVSSLISRSPKEIFEDKLRILPMAIATEADMSATFYANNNPAWGSMDYSLGCRHTDGKPAEPGVNVQEALKSRCSKHEVTTTTCKALILKFGTPTYLRVDVEADNWHCLDSLKDLARDTLPKYISVAVANKGFFQVLLKYGYTGFKAINLNGGGHSMWGDEVSGFDGKATWMTDKQMAKEIEHGLPAKTKDDRDAWYSLLATRG